MKRILTPQEVYGDEMSINIIDNKYVYYDDNTCLAIEEKNFT